MSALRPDLLWTLTDVTLVGGGKIRLDVPQLEIPVGRTAIMGPSGAGKSSLLNLLVEYERPTSGKIHRCASPSDSRLSCFWAPPDDALWSHLSVVQHLEYVLPIDSEPSRVGNLLKLFKLDAVARSKPETLSEGERSRLAVARAVAARPHVLVFDEPLVHVDFETTDAIWRFLNQEMAEQGQSLVFSSHSADTVLRESEHVVYLNGGNILAAGSTEQIYRNPPFVEVAKAFGPVTWVVPQHLPWWWSTLKRGDQSHVSIPAEPICLRPEMLAFRSDESGPLQVIEHRLVGPWSSWNLGTPAGPEQTEILTSRTLDKITQGLRGRLVWLCLLLWGISLVGCQPQGAEPQLSVIQESSWPLPLDGKRQAAPRGLAVDSEGQIFCLDTLGRVVVFQPDGQLIHHWFMPEYDVGRPEGICVLKDGRIAVADTHYHRVILFDREGHETFRFGQKGSQPGEFVYPVRITQDPEGFLYVAEYGTNDRVQKMTLTGESLKCMGKSGTQPGEFQRPSGLVWLDSKLYVVDAFNNRIQVFGDDGQFEGVLETALAELEYPYDVTLTIKKELAVVEYRAGRVSLRDRTGSLRGVYGKTGHGAGELQTPWAITWNGTDSLLVADTGNRRIVRLKLSGTDLRPQ